MSTVTIFIQIASYRDPELIPTIKNILETAEFPENLTFGICWQHGDDENLNEFMNDKRYKILDVQWKDSKGVCWARHNTQKLYNDETYTLQIDSHHRFIKNWDTELITMYKNLQEDGYAKPILTTYAAVYDPKDPKIYLTNDPTIMKPERFASDGSIPCRVENIPNYKDLTKPLRGIFVSGHFFFTAGIFCKEYEYDPELYFTGEEMSLSIRSFTMGYDIFVPHKLIMWHHYTRDYRKTHWEDHSTENKNNKIIDKTWYERDEYSKKKVKQLLQIEDNGIDLGKYVLGNVRSHRDYEIYAGIDFKKNKLQKYTLDAKEPPNPVDSIWLPDDNEYEYELEILWDLNNFEKCDNYLFWCISIHDNNNVDIYRYDLIYKDNKDIMNKNGLYKLKFKTTQIPYKYKIWPHTTTKEWLKAFESIISNNNIIKKAVGSIISNNNIIKKENKIISETIFIQIASYRDPELIPTLKNILAQAKHPKNLSFGICWQHTEEENLDEYLNNQQFKILSINWKESQGACWARSKVQQLYNNETYTLQLDSHHRFIKDWDVELISMYKKLQTDGFTKPLITSYGAIYEPPDIFKTEEPYVIRSGHFHENDGAVMFYPESIPNYKDLTNPVKARFASGHFYFTTGKHCLECKYDPNLYFTGEEMTLSVRSYTLGYDLFHPHKVILWHFYGRNYSKKHWDDHTIENKKEKIVDKAWYERDADSKKRVRQLLGMEDRTSDFDVFGEYGLGKSRTVKEYEIYSGIDFKKKKLQKYTIDAKEPPNPSDNIVWLPDDTEKEYEVEISWDINNLEKCNDYQFWYFGVLNSDNKELYRYDLIYKDNKDIMNKNGKYKLKFKSNRVPYKYKIWPYSVSKQWLKEYVNII